MAMPTFPVPMKTVRAQLGARLQASLREQWESEGQIPESDGKAMKALVDRFTGQQGCRLCMGATHNSEGCCSAERQAGGQCFSSVGLQALCCCQTMRVATVLTPICSCVSSASAQLQV